MFGGSSIDPAQQEMLSWLTGVGVGVGLGDGTDILDAIWPREDEVAAVAVVSSMEMQAPFPTSATTTTTITTTATTLPPLPSFGFSRAMETTAAAAAAAAAVAAAAAAVVEEQVSSNEAFAQAASRAAGQSSQPGLHSFRQLKTSTRFESSLLPPPPLPPLPLFPHTPQSHPLPFTSMSFPSPSQSEATASASVPVSFNAETETRPHSVCHPPKRQMQEESPGYMDLQVQCTSEDSSEIKLTEGRGRRRRRRKRKRRRRAAEVHNLSERRRRERINDKMKALQELIPNSNKMDKASVLDEAIEYMQLLQSQLKMLCMMAGSNVIVPPMMDPMACAYVWTNTHHGLGLEGTIMPTSVYTSSFHAEGSSAQQGPPMPTNLYPQALYPQVPMNLSMMNGYMTPPPHLQHEEQHYNTHQTNKHATQ